MSVAVYEPCQFCETPWKLAEAGPKCPTCHQLATQLYPEAPVSQARTSVRAFDTGATRNVDHDKLDFEGFISPRVLRRFAQYMHTHRHQADGTLRDSDNWQKGIPRSSYMKSMTRHFMDVWSHHRDTDADEDVQTALCGLLFNVQGMLLELLKENDNHDLS